MEPTEAQLRDFWPLIDGDTGETTVAERLRRAWDYVERETGNAAYLAQAHKLCTDIGIQQGHIEDRMFEALGRLWKLQEIENAAVNLCKVKGRHNSEIAMRRLMKVCSFEMPKTSAGMTG